MIPADVEKFVARKFDASERDAVLALLDAATIHDGSEPGARLLRCAVVASGGSLERLRMQLDTLKHDYRDVIVEAEYGPSGGKLVRIRNLNEPIPDEA